MQSTQSIISEKQIIDMVKEAVDQFFDTMMGHPLELDSYHEIEPDSENSINKLMGNEGSKVVSAVGFSGKANGVAYMYFSESFSKQITCAFLGMTEDEVDESNELVNDALGEMANMTIGTFKNKICDMGYECRLTIPSIVRGSEFCIEASSEVERRCLVFKTMGHKFLIDLILKQPQD